MNVIYSRVFLLSPPIVFSKLIHQSAILGQKIIRFLVSDKKKIRIIEDFLTITLCIFLANDFGH